MSRAVSLGRCFGQVVLKPLAVPDMQFSRVDGTSDALYAFELALMLEKFVYRCACACARARGKLVFLTVCHCGLFVHSLSPHHDRWPSDAFCLARTCGVQEAAGPARPGCRL